MRAQPGEEPGLHTRLDAPTIAFSLAHAEARILIVDKEFSKLAREALALMQGPHPIVIDYVDPEFPVDGERIGSIDYEQFVASGDAAAPAQPAPIAT